MKKTWILALALIGLVGCKDKEAQANAEDITFWNQQNKMLGNRFLTAVHSPAGTRITVELSSMDG